MAIIQFRQAKNKQQTPLMITSLEKDKVVVALLNQGEMTFPFNEKMVAGLEATGDAFELIMVQLEQKGLISIKGYKSCGVVTLTANLFDFYNHGGFTAQEEILRANLEKLNLELLKLSKDIEPSKLETVNTITAIASSVATALSLFKD